MANFNNFPATYQAVNYPTNNGYYQPQVGGINFAP